MKQSNNKQAHFQEILDLLSMSQVTDDRYSSPMQRCKTILPLTEFERFQDAINIFRTNKQAEEITISKYFVNQND